MKFERCILSIGAPSTADSGVINLPKNAFQEVDANGKFIAIKKRKSRVIRLVPLSDSQSVVYEVFCEIANGKLPQFIIGLKKIGIDVQEVQLLQEVLDGTCEGGANIPCTFDGFVEVKGDKISRLSDFKKKIAEMGGTSDTIVTKVDVTKVG